MVRGKFKLDSEIILTNRQKEILIGSLLGDAYITKRGQIQFEQSAKQKEYLFWKHQELSSVSYKNISKVNRFDKRFNKTYTSYRFWTRQFFKPLREKFYFKGKKIIPKDIIFTPLILAVWYMDDGCLSHQKCIISTESFSKRDLLILKEILLNKFGVEASFKNNSKLLIKKASFNSFFSVIKPFIIPSMSYKIFDPVTTSSCYS
ncbi:hypothetical protein FJZ41_00355 [Candidatus Shapirobacteria bacterium]|nr:hypothetical protein [Candidatus Shapirobacteria bacterium]